jgi:hypothetical protein
VNTFAALGDSLVVGMGDPMPDRTWRGWAALLAPALGAQLHNLATSGALSVDVEREQLPRALELQPDVANHPGTYDRRMWSVDRLHPSERGHRLIAYSYAEMLGIPETGRPDLEPINRPPSRRAQLGWLATKGTRWVADRSTDLVPYLAGMAFAEWWYGLRGMKDELDTRAERETVVALSSLAGPVRLTTWPDLIDATPTSSDR